MLYVDPGLGSMVFQVLAAGVVAGLLTLARIRTAIRGFFKRLWRR